MVTNSANVSVTRNLTVTVVPAPTIRTFGATSTASVTSGSPVTLFYDYAGGTGEIIADYQGTITAFPLQGPGSETVTAPDYTATLVLKVTNSIGVFVTQEYTVHVVPY
jgi:hypothetical protein